MPAARWRPSPTRAASSATRATAYSSNSAGRSPTAAPHPAIDGALYGIGASQGRVTIVNQGSIFGNYGAIYLGAGGTVSNTGTAALISGGRWGVYAYGGVADTVTNQCTISGGNGAVHFSITPMATCSTTSRRRLPSAWCRTQRRHRHTGTRIRRGEGHHHRRRQPVHRLRGAVGRRRRGLVRQRREHTGVGGRRRHRSIRQPDGDRHADRARQPDAVRHRNAGRRRRP